MMKQPQPNKEESEKEEKTESMLDKLKVDLKQPAIVSFIVFILLMPQSNSLLTMTKLEMFMNADGSVSIYGFFVKAVVAGLLFYLFSKYV